MWIEKTDDPEFERIYAPSETPSLAGIFRCLGCGCESIGGLDKPLPSEEQHRHPPGAAAARWRVVGSCDVRAKPFGGSGSAFLGGMATARMPD